MRNHHQIAYNSSIYPSKVAPNYQNFSTYKRYSGDHWSSVVLLCSCRLGLKLRSAADLLMQLCQMRYLETLHLSDNNLAVTSPHEDRDIQLLCSISQSLQNISNLRRLDLSSCQLSSQGIHVHRMQRGKRATLHKGTGEQHFGQVKHECREGFLALIASSSLSADPHEAASRVRRSGLMRHIEILNLVGNPMIEKG